MIITTVKGSKIDVVESLISTRLTKRIEDI